MRSFWEGDYYVGHDSLNKTIWTESPNVQRTLQDPSVLRLPGSFGAQQAMNESGIVDGVDTDTVLPWVPDLVGKEFSDPDGLLVVGTAYAGFIREYSSREGTLPLGDYHERSKQDADYSGFQRSFVREVVSRDRDYYRKIAEFLKPAGFQDASRIVLLDLCRASFVLRVGGPGVRNDDSNGAAMCCWPVFQQYVESAEPRAWVWQRIADSGARRIIALGTIAEHGLLRLFAAQLDQARIHRHRDKDKLPWRSKYRNYEPWAKNYANSEHQGRSCLDNSDWWVIVGGSRPWGVLTVPHPGSRNASYKGFSEVLTEMTRATNGSPR